MKYYKPIKEFYNPKEKYLFLGNGINLLSKGDSWGNLLQKIIEQLRIEIDFDGKTYPLLFEEIAFKLRSQSFVEHNISYLKRTIGEICVKYQPNEFHRKIIEKKYYQHYLTTNYDYTIEKTLLPVYDSSEGKNKKNPKYSIYRFNIVDKTKVWHIHGEIDNGMRGSVVNKEESILIGNEHYGDYHKKVHELLKGENGFGLYKLMLSAKENWVHLFFSRDIDIVGFGMDFNEFHLWFLLNFRARMLRKGTSIANKITWYIPSFTEKFHKPKIDLLTALKVNVEIIKANDGDYEMFYQNFLKVIS